MAIPLSRADSIALTVMHHLAHCNVVNNLYLVLQCSVVGHINLNRYCGGCVCRPAACMCTYTHGLRVDLRTYLNVLEVIASVSCGSLTHRTIDREVGFEVKLT